MLKSKRFTIILTLPNLELSVTAGIKQIPSETSASTYIPDILQDSTSVCPMPIHVPMPQIFVSPVNLRIPYSKSY